MMMGGAFYVGRALLGYISDQMGPTSCDRCDYLKVAPVAKWCSAGDFPQGTTVTVLYGPWPSIDPRIDMGLDLPLGP